MFSLDKTFCASPQCENKCGRKIDENDQPTLSVFASFNYGRRISMSWGYFCDEAEGE